MRLLFGIIKPISLAAPVQDGDTVITEERSTESDTAQYEQT
jgi:hypothetical protein